MKSSSKHPLSGVIHVDEFVVGGPEEGKKGDLWGGGCVGDGGAGCFATENTAD
jgi:hypothetical protein